MLGATNVRCIEVDETLADLSVEIAKYNESVNITVDPRMSTSLEKLPSPYDILITEIFDCGLLGESAVDSILHAKEGETLIYFTLKSSALEL